MSYVCGRGVRPMAGEVKESLVIEVSAFFPSRQASKRRDRRADPRRGRCGGSSERGPELQPQLTHSLTTHPREGMEDDDMMDPGIGRDDSEIGLPKSALSAHTLLRSF